MERQRSEAAYDLFYSHVLDKSKSLTDQLTLPRQRKLPKRIDSGSTAHQFDNPKLYFKKQYVTGPAKTGHICTNYTPLENGMFLGH